MQFTIECTYLRLYLAYDLEMKQFGVASETESKSSQSWKTSHLCKNFYVKSALANLKYNGRPCEKKI